MKKTKYIIAVVAAVVLVSGCDRNVANSANKERYKIVFNPNDSYETLLLDTEKGKIWRLVTFKNIEGRPQVWNPMDIIDNSGEIGIKNNEYLKNHTIVEQNK